MSVRIEPMSSFDLTGSPTVSGDPYPDFKFDSALAMDTSQLPPESNAKHLSPESIRVVSESVGLTGLSDEAAKELAEDATFRLKTLLQDAHKFMVHARRKELHAEDIDLALKSEGRNVSHSVPRGFSLAIKHPKAMLHATVGSI